MLESLRTSCLGTVCFIQPHNQSWNHGICIMEDYVPYLYGLMEIMSRGRIFICITCVQISFWSHYLCEI